MTTDIGPGAHPAHVEQLDCPCLPEARRAVGGGSFMAHRDVPEGRPTGENRAPDRYCGSCQKWHLLGHPHLEGRA